MYPVAGLHTEVEILLDEFGVPHLYADNEEDLFRAQGFQAAKDRLWQLDLWRRRGLGRLAEVFGARFVPRDRAARLFLYQGDMRAEWLAYGSSTRRVVTAFVEGVNAFLDLLETQPDLLPPEFTELGYQPAHWAPADVAIIRSHGLYGNLEQEVARAQTLRLGGPAAEDLRRVREPTRPLRIPDGLDLADITDDVLDVYRLATSPVTFDEPDLPTPHTRPEGSNNWVVGVSRTATGRPLLANDPHRAIAVPALRYLAHLCAPGFDVIGAGEACLPGISIGHNGSVAFGLTIFPIDQEDLYVYETNPDAPNEYRYEDRWVLMRMMHETIEVAGGRPVAVELAFTRHGPVIHNDPDRHRAFAVRAAWLEAGMAPYLGSIEVLRARTADEFVDATNRWGAPGENLVYATPDGTIGWRPVGLVPVRPNWDGTLPVPGDGRYEWGGFHHPDELPSVRGPASDWLATANEMNLPLDLPYHVSYDWDHRFRYERIAEVLSESKAMTVDDCTRLQTDTVDVSARRILVALEGLRPDPSTAEAVELLQSWDCDTTRDSAAAALYQIWLLRHLRPAVVDAALTHTPERERLRARLLIDEEQGCDVRSILAVLNRLSPEVLRTSLAAALAETRTLLGDDMSRWRWGALLHAAPAHPLGRRLPRRERAGAGDTVMYAGYDEHFTQVDGASFRIVVDVGDWDRSRAVNAPGQSGRPDSPHWSNHYDTWADDGAFPLYYTRAAVEAHTIERYTLIPSHIPQKSI